MTDISSFEPMTVAVAAALALSLMWFAYARGTALMMFFQQEEYDNARFVTWYKDKQAFDRAASICLLIAAILSASFQSDLTTGVRESAGWITYLPFVLLVVGFALGLSKSRAALRDTKKPLVKTDRVKRILRTFLLLVAAAVAGIIVITSLAATGSTYSVSYDATAENWLDTFAFLSTAYDWRFAVFASLTVLLFQALPFLIITANKLLEPAEERVKAKFRNEAVEKFNRLAPKVVAITGSFGKTSTKHILAHILDAAAPTLATPGSVNTEMGITRVIREQLTPEHQFFIVEMGAYGPGSIARLCRLTPPDVALVTAVGAAHYERFKTLETVAKAKFEIAEAVFKKGGKAVVSTDGIPEHLLKERMSVVEGDYIQVGSVGDIVLESYDLTANGLEIKVKDGDETQTLLLPLYGRHQAGNAVVAAATARALGLPWAAIKGALATVPQIRYRLEVAKSSDAPTIINDAYNSNPIGFAAALECLDVLVEEGGRRILVTPGMVELGAIHDEEHERLGKLTAVHTDIVCVVTPDRIPTYVTGLEAANDGSKTVMTFATQDAAETWVKNNWQPADAVLFENNLPDLYEAEVRF